MTRLRWYGPTLLLLATVVLAMVFGPTVVRRIARASEAQRVEQVRAGLADNPTLATMSEAFKDVALVVSPSLTKVTVYRRSAMNQDLNRSNGSGWVYRHYPDPADPGRHRDYIITNHHVIADALPGPGGEPPVANRLVVRFADGGDYYGQVVGTDRQTDVAVLEIDREGMLPAVIASEPAQQGEIVFAFGSPFEFDFSMSQGVVSATGRSLGGLSTRSDRYEDYVQTDAAINPGNSGGPLTNVRGEVVGMNTAIATDGNPQATFSGLGFAIPADLVVDVVEQLIEHGEVRRGYLGVFIHDIDARTADELGLDHARGVLCSPSPGSPAARAGIELGDVITHIGTAAVANSEKLRIEIARHAPGSEVEVRLWRDGSVSRVTVQLAEYPRPNAAALGAAPRPRTPALGSVSSKLGFDQLDDYTPREAEERGWAYTPGVLIRMVRSTGPAYDAGVQRMMVITHVGGQRLNEVADLVSHLDSLRPGDRVELALKAWDRGADGFGASSVWLVVP